MTVQQWFAKLGAIDSTESWQLCRAARNLAAHDDETDDTRIAAHVHELHGLHGILIRAAARLLNACAGILAIKPASTDFADDFAAVCTAHAV